MTFLLSYWRYALVAGLVVVVLAFTYRIGGASDRAENKALKAAAVAYAAESKRIAEEKDRDYLAKLAANDDAWADWMLKHPAKAPANLVANVCGDRAIDNQLSIHFSEYVAEVGRFRAETAELLERASQQQEQLSCAVDWSLTINR